MPDGMWDLVRRCWSPDPSSRPQIEDVVKKLRELQEVDGGVSSPGREGDTAVVALKNMKELREEDETRRREQEKRYREEREKQLFDIVAPPVPLLRLGVRFPVRFAFVSMI
jgi:hypothetical protein